VTDQLPEATPEDRDAADAVYAALLARVGEAAPQPRLHATARAVELLGDPHRAAPVIHLTGTNGKTSTSRMIESILRAQGLRTGLLTSPHLVRFTERIRIDGEPIADEAVARNWDEVAPFVDIVDVELTERGEEPLTFFEALTVLAFAAFADAPVDVVVLEVGMGGEWDSTNVADGQVAVFTPIAFAVLDSKVAVGGQLVSIRGLAGEYRDLALPLYGRHQAENAAIAVAAVESFLGGAVRLADDVLEDGLGAVSSPGRLHPISTEPTVLVDAAHNPHGAAALVDALTEYFDFDELVIVLGVLGDKDAAGIVRALQPTGARFVVTQSESDRAVPAGELAASVASIVGADRVDVVERLDDALDEARDWASRAEKRGVVVTGSITLVGDAMAIADDREWGSR
jgi:dihydrofolate synthase/folylpolyglutamate synthase